MQLSKNHKGFTLMEIIVAMAIIAIIAGPLLQTFLTSTRVGQISYDMDKANTVAVHTVEEIKGNPRGSFVSGFTPSTNNVGSQVYYTFTRSEYYAANWSSPSADASLPFRVVTTMTGKDSTGTGLDSLSYFPQLISQSASKQNYHIEASYAFMNQGTYPLELILNGDRYTLSTSAPILKSSRSGANSTTVDIPAVDCTSGIIPVVVDLQKNPSKQISFDVNNQTDMELGFYIYGDDISGSHWITALPSSGVVNINYMKPLPTQTKFDQLDVNVKIYRQKDSSLLTDYTSMIYIP